MHKPPQSLNRWVRMAQTRLGYPSHWLIVIGLAFGSATAQAAGNGTSEEVVVRDGLMWTQRDNGGDVNWSQAARYCSKSRLKGHRDWRLPTIEELRGLSDMDREQRTLIRSRVSGDSLFVPMHIVKGFTLSAPWVWSATAGRDEERRMVFEFVRGIEGPLPMSRFDGHRCLCVREVGTTK